MPDRKVKVADKNARRNFPELYSLFKGGDTPGLIRNRLAGILSKFTGAEVLPQIPLKHDRIKYLVDSDFNVMDYRYWLRGQLPGKMSEFEKFFYKYVNQDGISLRTVTEEKYNQPSPQLPVRYCIKSLYLAKTFCLENNKYHHTLVHQGLPLAKSLYSGNFILMNDTDYLAAFIKGYGTPRSVDQPDVKNLLVFGGQFDEPTPDWAPEFIASMSDKLRNLVPELRPIIVEFSVYPEPVGLLGLPVVFWEWRCCSPQDLYRLIMKALPHFRSFELVGDFGSDEKKVLPFPSTLTPQGIAKLSIV